MTKFLKILSRVSHYFRFGSVVLGTVVSALAATSLGGDPAMGASIGGSVTALTNVAVNSLH